MTLRPDTSLRVMTKNSSFFRFIAVSLAIAHTFGVSYRFYNDRKTRYMFESNDQKFVVFALYYRFHELLPTVWWF